jgi:hypothetical protein
MLVFLTTFLAILTSILRSCAAVELENLALRHQIGVLQTSAATREDYTATNDGLPEISLTRLRRAASWLSLHFDGMTSVMGCTEFSGGTGAA